MTSLPRWFKSSAASKSARRCNRSLIASILGIFCVAPVLAQDADRDLTSNGSGTHNGYYYNFWKDTGTLTFGLREAGRYTARWNSGVNNWIGGIGWNTGSGEKIIKYSGQYGDSSFNQKNSYLTLYGWTRNPRVEYYIIESWGSYNPSNCSGTSHGSYQSDGATYELRRCRIFSQLAIADADYDRYYAVRTPKKPFGQISGTITVANHFNFWALKGLALGQHDFMIFATEGYQSGGSVDMTVGDGALPVVPLNCGESSGVPICCRITADPDRDGTGSQNNGQVCTVTEATQGWHPPNPPDVLAAVNAGGKDQDELAGDIYYSPYNYGAQGFASVFETANVAGSDGSAVYKSAMYEWNFTYEIPVSEKHVTVELGFVEFYQEQTEGRLFDVSIEGQRVLTNADIFANVGYRTLWKPTPFVTTVNDGKLTISLTATLGQATLSSILVRKINSGTSSTSSASSSSSSSSSSTSSSSSSSSSSSTSSTSSSGGAATVAGSTGWLLLLTLISLPILRLKKKLYSNAGGE